MLVKKLLLDSSKTKRYGVHIFLFYKFKVGCQLPVLLLLLESQTDLIHIGLSFLHLLYKLIIIIYQMDPSTKIPTSKIGYYHYNMFSAAYGAPKFLNVYKLEYSWLLLQIFYMLIGMTIEPYPIFNKAVDDLTSDPRAAYTYYWFPTFFYIWASIFALSDYMSRTKRYTAQFFGVLALVWHIIYFIVFWAAPSSRLPGDVSTMSVSAGWYWSELFVNQIFIIIQCSATIGTKAYVPYRNEKRNKVDDDIKCFLNIQKTQPDQGIMMPAGSEAHPDEHQEPQEDHENQGLNQE